MPVVFLDLPTPIRYLTQQGDWTQLDLLSLPGWRMLAPDCVDYGALPYRLGHMDPVPNMSVLRLGDEGLTFGSPKMILFTENDASSTETFTMLRDWLTKFIEWTRVLSRQWAIPPRATVTSMSVPSESIETGERTWCSRAPTAFSRRVPTYRVDDLVTLKVLKAADEKCSLSEAVPVELTALFDAQLAANEGDFRRSLVFSAVAMESGAAGVLERKYSTLKAEDEAAPIEYRLTAIKTSSGTIWKDPVYEALCKSTNFSMLLHERPLYLLKRSLLHDDQGLFRTALDVYKARNKLVHRGEVGDGHKLSIAVDTQGAENAAACAAKVLEWFGLIPTLDHRSGTLPCTYEAKTLSQYGPYSSRE